MWSKKEMIELARFWVVMAAGECPADSCRMCALSRMTAAGWWA